MMVAWLRAIAASVLQQRGGESQIWWWVGVKSESLNASREPVGCVTGCHFDRHLFFRRARATVHIPRALGLVRLFRFRSSKYLAIRISYYYLDNYMCNRQIQKGRKMKGKEVIDGVGYLGIWKTRTGRRWRTP